LALVPGVGADAGVVDRVGIDDDGLRAQGWSFIWRRLREAVWRA